MGREEEWRMRSGMKMRCCQEDDVGSEEEGRMRKRWKMI